MESIFFFFAQPFFIIFDLLVTFKFYLLSSFLTLKEDVPATVNILNFLKDSLLIYLQGFNLMFTLRFVLGWFPNINPFIAPFYIVRVITQPILDWVDERLPRVFGLDLSFLVCSFAIGFSINLLSKYTFK